MSKKRPANAAPGKTLSPEAIRALQEAEARQKSPSHSKTPPQPSEKNGPKGAEPTRFGDWERGGIAYDF